MADYGDTLEPGITTNLESALSVSKGGESPAVPVLIGQANLAGATSPANPNEVYSVSRINAARKKFGDEANSMLTQGIIDCFGEGGNPVFVVAPEEISVTAEDISGISSTSGTLANTPVIEDPSAVTFEVDSTTKDTILTYEDPSTKTPQTDEAYYNPVTGAFELDSAPSSSGTVDYTHFDYESAIDALANAPSAAESMDILSALNENSTVQGYAQTVANNLASDYDLALLVAAQAVRVDPSNVSNNFDDSRVQSVYPTRNGDGDSTLAAFVGERARIGISTTPINQRLDTQKTLAVNLSRQERGNLIDARIVPLAQEAAGARIADDPTTVDPTGSAEDRNVDFGFNRLLLDFIIETAYVNQRPFIGRLNNPNVRNTLEGLINGQLSVLANQNLVLSYNVSVEPVDATSVALDIGVETAKPLRNIENNVTVGDAS